MTKGEFSVYQFFPNDTWEKVRDHVSAEDAMDAFMQFTSSVGARIGTTVRVIITDGEDFTNADWKFGEGLVYPTKEHLEGNQN